MIKINLLNHLDVVPAKEIVKVPFTIKGPWLAATLAVSVVIVSMLGVFYYLKSAPIQMPLDQLAVRQTGPIPQAPAYKPLVIQSYAVEDAVRELREEHRRTYQGSSYKGLKPTAKVGFQLAASNKFLHFIKNITPPEIGFSSLIFTVPGDFYLHGMAINDEYYQNLKIGLERNNTLNVKPGILKPVGNRGVAREFSFYGKVGKGFVQNNSKVRMVKASMVNSELKSFKNIAQSSGLDLESITLKSKVNLGSYKRYVYKTSAPECDFENFQIFINKLHVAKSNVGLLKFSLRAVAEELMTATFDIVLYVN
jgi:hypothetical protein